MSAASQASLGYVRSDPVNGRRLARFGNSGAAGVRAWKPLRCG